MAIEKVDFELIKVFQDKPAADCAILGDCAFHCFDSSDEFKKAADFHVLDTFDINGNPTHKVDLNEPIPSEFHASYDWVIDSGTSYCCFDIGTVFKNIVKMLKPGGYVLHTGNLTGFFGRGYYSLSPALFSEFYPLNGFEIVKLATRTRNYRAQWLDMTPGDNYLQHADESEMRFSSNPRSPFVSLIPNDTMICCVAKKISEIPFKKPVPQHFINTNGR